MEDNKRLILGTTVSGEDDVSADTTNTQAFNASIPADVEHTALLDVSTSTSGNGVSNSDSITGNDDILLLPVIVDLTTGRDITLPLDTRIASSRWAADDINGQLNPQLVMASHLRSGDAYLTVVDMLGRAQPGVHHLLKEGGSGFITYENGNRILII